MNNGNFEDVSAANSVDSRDGAALKEIVDQASAYVATTQMQFSEADQLVAALNPGAKDEAAKALRARAQLLEERLTKAYERQRDAARDYAAFRVSIAESSSKIGAAQADKNKKSKDAPASESRKFLKRKLPEPTEGWKDSSGKTHRKNLDLMKFHKVVSAGCWAMLDICRELAKQNPESAEGSELEKEVRLARLVPLADFEKRVEEKEISFREILEVMLNHVHESAHTLYVRHIYGHSVAESFVGDDLFGSDRSLPVEDRVDTAVKRVQKLSAAAKAAGGGSTRGGGSGRKGASGRGGYKRPQGQQHATYQQAQLPPGFGGVGRNPARAGGAPQGGNPVCFGCGAAGHYARDCPNKQ